MHRLILTKFLPATDTKGSRVKAWLADDRLASATLDYAHALSGEENHRAAADHLLDRTGFSTLSKYRLLPFSLDVSGGFGFVAAPKH